MRKNDFEVFVEYCKYHGRGYDEDHSVVDVCTKEDMIPVGHSWGICDPIHCPAFNCQCLTADDIKHAEEHLSREPEMTCKVAASTISGYVELCMIYGGDRVETVFNTKINDAVRSAIAETLKELKEAECD